VAAAAPRRGVRPAAERSRPQHALFRGATIPEILRPACCEAVQSFPKLVPSFLIHSEADLQNVKNPSGNPGRKTAQFVPKLASKCLIHSEIDSHNSR
jgi:hypothetical protein